MSSAKAAHRHFAFMDMPVSNTAANLQRLTAAAEPAATSKKVTKAEYSSHYYRLVCELNDRWRVILCPAGIQFIIQYRASAKSYHTERWKGVSFCRFTETLLRECNSRVGEVRPEALVVLAELPSSAEGYALEKYGCLAG